jgi:DNA-binding transcriptional regulator GbsR (MarR family)
MDTKTANFINRIGQFYAHQYNLPPVTGRLLGYLGICEPMQQSIGDLAEALQASRSAITSAIDTLEHYHLVRRERPAGSRADLISIDTTGLENNGFDPALYAQQASLAREGLTLLEHASSDRRKPLEEIAGLAEFLAERLPALLEEWQKRKHALSNNKRSSE